MTAKKMSPVVHFEMPAKDRKRVADFYTKAFGWKMDVLGEDMSNYVLATTTDSDDNGPKKPGAINGGFYPIEEGKPDQYPSVVVAVDHIDESVQDVKDAGGKILTEKMEIPGIGTYVSFLDSEENRVGMLQPAPMP